MFRSFAFVFLLGAAFTVFGQTSSTEANQSQPAASAPVNPAAAPCDPTQPDADGNIDLTRCGEAAPEPAPEAPHKAATPPVEHVKLARWAKGDPSSITTDDNGHELRAVRANRVLVGALYQGEFYGFDRVVVQVINDTTSPIEVKAANIHLVTLKPREAEVAYVPTRKVVASIHLHSSSAEQIQSSVPTLNVDVMDTIGSSGGIDFQRIAGADTTSSGNLIEDYVKKTQFADGSVLPKHYVIGAVHFKGKPHLKDALLRVLVDGTTYEIRLPEK